MRDLQAIRRLVETGRYDEAASLADSLLTGPLQLEDQAEATALRMTALNGMGRWAETLALGDTILPRLTGPSFSGTKAKVHALVGYARLRLGEPRRAESHLRAAIHIATWDLDDPAQAVQYQRLLAFMFHGLGLWRQARHELTGAIEVADSRTLLKESGGLRINLAVTELKFGDIHGVPAILDAAEDFLARASQTKRLLLARLIRANYLRITSQPNKALELLEAALVTCRDQRFSREEAITLEYMGDCYLAKKDYQRALDLYNEGMKIAEATAPKGDLVPELCHRVAECLTYLGSANDAILACERGLRVARDIGDRYEECATHRVLAMSQKAAGNPSKALRTASEGIELGRAYEIPYELGRLLAWAGEARLAMPGLDEQALGRRQLWEARGHFTRMGLRHWIEAIDRTLGYEPAPEAGDDEQSLLPLAELEELDRGALRFGLVTCNAQVRDAVATVQSIAPSQIPVLICGESGVGKELLARAVHQMSDRRKGPFIAVNCGAIATSLLESEMFGHERGAFTGAVTSREGLIASADRGTLFLDEIADLPLPVQASLLRVLESGELRPLGKDSLRRVDIRIVAATNANLEDLVVRGVFRQDLYFRLNGVRVTLPPLREREEDVRALFRYFWAQACAAAKKTLRVAPDVEPMLAAYAWPGNVRELRHEIVRVVALAPDASLVTPEHFLPGQRRKDAFALRRGRARKQALDVERDEILTALRAHGGNKAEAARSLGGMKRTTLIYKMERLRIRPEEYGGKE